MWKIRVKMSKLSSYKSSLGLKSVLLAFALGSGCSPVWGGRIAIDSSSTINGAKQFGSDVIV